MRQRISLLFRLTVIVSVLLGVIQPRSDTIAHLLESGRTNLPEVKDVLAPTTSIGSVWPGQVLPNYHYSQTFGKTGQPYPAGGQLTYLNSPAGLVLDAQENLYIVEANGSRLFGLHTTDDLGASLFYFA